MTSPESQPTTPKPKRRWLRYGLCAVLLLLVVAGLGIGWVAVRMQQVRRQREAVEAIEKYGGWAEPDEDGSGAVDFGTAEATGEKLYGQADYDYQVDASGNPTDDATPPGPPWLRRLLGDDFFTDVVSVTVISDSIGLEHLVAFPRLRQVTICHVHGPGLEQLKSLPQLRKLELHWVADAAALAHLKGLTQLREIDLSSAGITDAGLEHLKELTQLQIQKIDLTSTPITDAGLAHLKGLTQLRQVDLSSTSITGAGLEHLKGLTALREVDLSNTQITDAGLEHLAALPRLEGLGLANVKISDAGLAHVKALNGLKKLTFCARRVTAAGLENLKSLTQLEELAIDGIPRDATWSHAAAKNLATIKTLRELFAYGLAASDLQKLQQELPGCGINLFQGMAGGGSSCELALITNSIGMKLAPIPAGEFMMGSGESAEHTAAFFNKTYDKDCLTADDFKQEHPQHRVRITRPFYLSMHHVTRGQFRRFVAESDYKTDAEKGRKPGADGLNPEKGEFEFSRKYSWRDAGYEETDEHPVVNVSWNDAVAFCQWLTRKEGKTYRLPTEAEWEYACRAGMPTRYYSGDDPETLPDVGNVADAAAKVKFPDWKWAIKTSDGYVFTAPVGTFRPNAFWLYDMHGNAWQWCADWYGKDYYGKSPTDDPTGPDSGDRRVLRGGSWCSGPYSCRSAARCGYPPDYRDHATGFRVARAE
jgi:formylglycine-generating enzyme required for sulfatase activity